MNTNTRVEPPDYYPQYDTYKSFMETMFPKTKGWLEPYQRFADPEHRAWWPDPKTQSHNGCFPFALSGLLYSMCAAAVPNLWRKCEDYSDTVEVYNNWLQTVEGPWVTLRWQDIRGSKDFSAHKAITTAFLLKLKGNPDRVILSGGVDRKGGNHAILIRRRPQRDFFDPSSTRHNTILSGGQYGITPVRRLVAKRRSNYRVAWLDWIDACKPQENDHD